MAMFEEMSCGSRSVLAEQSENEGPWQLSESHVNACDDLLRELNLENIHHGWFQMLQLRLAGKGGYTEDIWRIYERCI